MVTVMQCVFTNSDNCETNELSLEQCSEKWCETESEQYEICVWNHVDCTESDQEIGKHKCIR